MSTTPPRNVIYYDDNHDPISLAGISGLPYTDVILGFLVPGGNFNLAGQGGAFGSEGNPDPDDIQALDEFTSQVIAPLLQRFGSAFGGVMGWEFSYDQCGTWAEGTAQALAGGTGTGAPTPGQQYTIRAGDTLYSIATAAYGAADAGQGVTALEAANPGIDPDDLQIGQVIYIPALT